MYYTLDEIAREVGCDVGRLLRQAVSGQFKLCRPFAGSYYCPQEAAAQDDAKLRAAMDDSSEHEARAFSDPVGWRQEEMRRNVSDAHHGLIDTAGLYVIPRKVLLEIELNGVAKCTVATAVDGSHSIFPMCDVRLEELRLDQDAAAYVRGVPAVVSKASRAPSVHEQKCAAIITAIRRSGFDPLSFPPHKPGAHHGPKGSVRDTVLKAHRDLFQSDKQFSNTWQQMRAEKRIVESPT